MKKKILIIEDNEKNRYLAYFILKQAGYEIFEAVNGEEGLRQADVFRPDLILLDIQLPGMDGYKVFERLKTNENVKKIPVIAVTSYAMPGDKEKALEMGFDGYMEKPINTDTFLDQIKFYFTENK
ncbi:MAG: response regulator [Elusimicrobia bacterium]|nr:response regulator [Elusimicrobiota bacterium]